MYFWGIVFSWITQVLSTPFGIIQPHIITLTKYFTVYVMQLGYKSYPILPLTYFMPSILNREISDSSDQITLSPSSAVQVTPVLAQFSLFNLCWRYTNDFFRRIIVFKPFPFSLLRTILACNITLACAISPCIHTDEFLLLTLHRLSILLSSCAFVYLSFFYKFGF